jgi:formiminotetrahydrofolate cyclodeaminase
MVCLHTSEAERSERLVDAAAELRDTRDRLLALADADGAAVNEVQTAFDAETDESHEQEILRTATEIPVQIAEAARDVATCAPVVVADGTPNARADAVVGAIIARAAVESAAAIVRANVGLLDDAFASDVLNRVDSAEADADAAVAAVTDQGE